MDNNKIIVYKKNIKIIFDFFFTLVYNLVSKIIYKNVKRSQTVLLT